MSAPAVPDTTFPLSAAAIDSIMAELNFDAFMQAQQRANKL